MAANQSDFFGGGKASLKCLQLCHVNLGWVATCDCVSNNSITVQFGNIMEVAPGWGSVEDTYLFLTPQKICARQVATRKRFLLLNKTSNQPIANKNNKQTICKHFSGWCSGTAAFLTEVLGKAKPVYSFIASKVIFHWWNRCSSYLFVTAQSLSIHQKTRDLQIKRAFHHPTSNIQFQLL